MRRLLFILLTSLAIIAPARAQDHSLFPQTLRVSMIRQQTPGMDAVLVLFFSAGTNQFFMQSPYLYRAQNEPSQGRVKFLNNDNGSWLTFRILYSRHPDFKLDSAICRTRIFNDYPNATITAESSIQAADSAGPAFDVKWRTGGGFTECCHIAFVQTSVGVMEFVANSTEKGFADAKEDLARMVSSLHYAPNGVRDIPPPPSPFS